MCKLISHPDNLTRMAELEVKIADYRQKVETTPPFDWRFATYKLRLSEYVVEYQERQLIQEQMERRK